MSLVIHKVHAFKTIYFQFHFLSEDIALMLPDLLLSSCLHKYSCQIIFSPQDQHI